MTDIQHQVQIAAHLYEARDTVRRFLGDEYQFRMREYETVIKAVASKRGIDELEAAVWIVKDAKLQSFAALYVLAAAVELVEPST